MPLDTIRQVFRQSASIIQIDQEGKSLSGKPITSGIPSTMPTQNDAPKIAYLQSNTFKEDRAWASDVHSKIRVLGLTFSISVWGLYSDA